MDNSFETDLTEEETERLALLLEECGEVQQIIGKILRHGYGSYSPFDESKTSNRTFLEKEVADIQVAITLLIQSEDISIRNLGKFRTEKRQKVNKYLHFNELNQ